MSTLGKISRLEMARLFEQGAFSEDVKQCKSMAQMVARKRKIERVTEEAWHKQARPRLMNISEAEACLMQNVAMTLGNDAAAAAVNIDAYTGMFDIGFTSMHVVKLKHHLEKRLEASVPLVQIMKSPTIQSLTA